MLNNIVFKYFPIQSYIHMLNPIIKVISIFLFKNMKLTKEIYKSLKEAEEKVMAFSYSGLIGQLEFEGYTNEEAAYGADNCGADWNEQALRKSQSYLDITSFSYTGLVGQLEFDGFTHEQAIYGADNCGADWNEQAIKKAKSYLEIMSFSKEGLIGQLEFDGFTYEQAVYGAEQNGY